MGLLEDPACSVFRNRGGWGSPQGATTHDIRCTRGPGIRLISGWYSLYPAFGFSQNMAVFSDFSSFLLPDHCLLISGWYLGISSRYFLTFCWNPSDISLKFDQFSLDIRLLCLWYPPDILDTLMSDVPISSMLLQLGCPCFHGRTWKYYTLFKPSFILVSNFVRLVVVKYSSMKLMSIRTHALITQPQDNKTSLLQLR